MRMCEIYLNCDITTRIIGSDTYNYLDFKYSRLMPYGNLFEQAYTVHRLPCNCTFNTRLQTDNNITDNTPYHGCEALKVKTYSFSQITYRNYSCFKDKVTILGRLFQLFEVHILPKTRRIMCKKISINSLSHKNQNINVLNTINNKKKNFSKTKLSSSFLNYYKRVRLLPSFQLSKYCLNAVGSPPSITLITYMFNKSYIHQFLNVTEQEFFFTCSINFSVTKTGCYTTSFTSILQILSPADLPADSNAGCITDVRRIAGVFELDLPVDAASDDEKIQDQKCWGLRITTNIIPIIFVTQHLEDPTVQY
ncbi:hypothetical protein AGLY_013666 [Aphis glycines]|uniref:Uncharacterized protein n=1 Tax=Aphis glycines TaxID=307491 RepID=A0A6G0T6Y4_APHGL|nr:hypothetical protein AGLY_013666 [Aphis glycines]